MMDTTGVAERLKVLEDLHRTDEQVIDRQASMIAELRVRAERAEAQLAGCSVAAKGYAEGRNDAASGDYGHSASFDDVKELRARYEAALATLVRLGSAWAGFDALHYCGLPTDAAVNHLGELFAALDTGSIEVKGETDGPSGTEVSDGC